MLFSFPNFPFYSLFKLERCNGVEVENIAVGDGVWAAENLQVNVGKSLKKNRAVEAPLVEFLTPRPKITLYTHSSINHSILQIG